MRFFLFLCMAFAVLPTPLFAADTAVECLKDEFRETVLVSGSTKVGAMISASAPKHDFSQIRAFVRPDVQPDKHDICLKISSIDGKYLGLFAAHRQQLPQEDGYVRIPLESDYIDKLRDYFIKDQIVVLASLQESCRRLSKRVSYVPVSWGPTPQTDVLDVYVNSNAVDTQLEVVFVEDEQKRRIQIPCEKIRESNTRVYNTKCSFNRSRYPHIDRLNILELEPGEDPDRERLRLVL